MHVIQEGGISHQFFFSSEQVVDHLKLLGITFLNQKHDGTHSC